MTGHGGLYGKGDRGKATKLHAQLVRSRGRCERCGATDKLQAAHIMRRRYAATRTDEANAWCLCASCHFRIDGHADEFMELVEATIGRAEFDRLKAKAQTVTKVNWRAEVARLTALLSEKDAA